MKYSPAMRVALIASVLLLPACDGSFFGGPTETPVKEEAIKSVGKPVHQGDTNGDMRHRHMMLAPIVRSNGSVRGMLKMFLSVIIDRYLEKFIDIVMGHMGNQMGDVDRISSDRGSGTSSFF